jgi:hypothetical protein
MLVPRNPELGDVLQLCDVLKNSNSNMLEQPFWRVHRASHDSNGDFEVDVSQLTRILDKVDKA